LEKFYKGYVKCKKCNTLILGLRPSDRKFLAGDGPENIYNKDYWFKHMEEIGLLDIFERSKSDIPERCIYWLRDILKYKLPPAKTLEIGCAHGGLVFLMGLAGYNSEGAEMSLWICEYANKTFNIPIKCGRMEDLNIPPKTFDIIILMDVLEHMPDPIGGLKSIKRALKEDGLIVIQTPCWREIEKTCEERKAENNSFLSNMLIAEHLYLFNQRSIKLILNKVGFPYVEFETPIFPYDMFVFAGKRSLDKIEKEIIVAELLKTPEKRIILALIDVYEKLEQKAEKLLKVIDDLQKKYEVSEADRAARLKVIDDLQKKYEVSEADRAARLKVIDDLQKKYEVSEADRAARLKVIDDLQKKYEVSEADRAARLKVIENLSSNIQSIEKNLRQKCEEYCRIEEDFKRKYSEVESREKELERIKLSLSWRITTPLRWIYNRIGAENK
jgi:2-polyprenyl-3-methyl-5-hydroxy-6-metoxy-1,4-benzoquinol methylase